MERRTINEDFQSEGRKLVGYGAVFNSPTMIHEYSRSYEETILSSAFRNSLSSGRDILCAYNHDITKLLGRTSSGTLAVSEDARGLRFEVELPDTQTSNEVRTLVERGDLTGASFAFTIRPNSVRWEGEKRRYLSDLDLFELGPVAVPGYEAAELVGLRSRLPLLKLKLAAYEKWMPHTTY